MSLPNPLRRRLLRLVRPAPPRLLRPTRPLSERWGYDRGTPVDRYYIEAWLARHATDVKGTVLEVKDADYTRRFGGTAVTHVDVLDVDSGNPQATIIADLARADAIASASFECVILTQTLQLVYELPAAVEHVRRILRPGGVALVTVPTMSRVVLEHAASTDFWRFSRASCERLFGDAFGPERVEVETHGNLDACTSFLMGMAADEVGTKRLQRRDERFPLIVTVRATAP